MPMYESPMIHMVLKVPKDLETEMDAYWKSHEEWMRRSHVMANDVDADKENGNDEIKPRLREFHISKGPEMKDPVKPEEGDTGKLVYVMTETYVASTGISKHMELGGNDWAGMKKVKEYVDAYGVHTDVNAIKVFKCFDNSQVASVGSYGNPTIHMVWRVPKEAEAEVDEFWNSHENFMRKCHVMAKSVGDNPQVDGKSRLTGYVIGKGEEMMDSFNPDAGYTGNLIYTMDESYVDDCDIKAHFKLLDEEWAEGLPKITTLIGKYSVHLDIGSNKVITCHDSH